MLGIMLGIVTPFCFWNLFIRCGRTRKMPAKRRFKTKYPGVYYIEAESSGLKKTERVYYVIYRKNGKLIEEKAGRQVRDDMTPSRAARIRAQRIDGDQLSNKEQREVLRIQKQAEKNRWTFNRLWVEYKNRNPNLKALPNYESIFQKYVKPNFGDKEPSELTPFEVDRLRVILLKTKKPSTVRNILERIRALSNFGSKKQLCEGLSFSIQMPKVNNVQTEDLTPGQLTRLLKAIEDDPHVLSGNMMKMALFTGMRRSELFKLRWEDVDFQRRFILIRDPKGGPDQTIPLNDVACAVLESHPRTKSPYVFPGRGGGPRGDVHKQINRIKKRAGLPKDFRPLHGLRHVYASMLASSGQVDMYTLQKLLTHKSPMMTQRYAHLRDEALRRASDLAGELIGEIVDGKKQGQDRQKEK